MKFSKQIVLPIAAIVLGFLFLVFQGGAIGFAMTALGVAYIVMGIMDIMYKKQEFGAVQIIAGVVIILFGWILAKAVLYIVAGVIIYNSISLIYKAINLGYPLKSLLNTFILLIGAIFMFFNKGGLAKWSFIICGILFIIYGAHSLYISYRNKR